MKKTRKEETKFEVADNDLWESHGWYSPEGCVIQSKNSPFSVDDV